MKHIKQMPLFVMLLLSALFLAGTGIAGAGDTYLHYRQQENNPFAWVFLGIRDGVWPWEIYSDGGEDAKALLAEIEENETQQESGNDKETNNDSGVINEAPKQETQEEDIPESAGEQEKTYSFETVEESYFEDALFIGDSRTVGLWEYAGLEDKADFFCKTSLTIWNVMDKPFIKTEDGRTLTVEEALQEKSYGKIYLMLGINELGRGTTQSFMEEYKRVVEQIRQLQPDAVIFVEGIMRVAGEKSRTDPIFNNRHINEKNQNIAMLADNKTVFYIDVNEAVCDENGDLTAEYTNDQIHLKAAYYELWKQFLLEHGIIR